MDHWRKIRPVEWLEVSYEEAWLPTLRDTRGPPCLIFSVSNGTRACAGFHENERAIGTASLSQVRQPIHANSVGRW